MELILKKINLDTNEITNVVSIFDGQRNTRNMFCYGWTTGDKFVCSVLNDNWSNGGYLINIKGGAKEYIPNRPLPQPPYGSGDAYILNSCDQIHEDNWIYPNLGHGHGDISPNRTMSSLNMGFGSNCSLKGIFVKNSCGGNEYFVNETSGFVSHTSWKSSDEWYLGSGIDSGNWKSAPNIVDMSVYQVFFTPDHENKAGSYEYNLLWTMKSSGRWESSIGAQDHYNWGAFPIATLRNDGQQALFFSTNGKYSYKDYVAHGNPGWSSNDWGTIGSFLVDLSPASGSDTTPPAAPLNVAVQ